MKGRWFLPAWRHYTWRNPGFPLQRSFSAGTKTVYLLVYVTTPHAQNIAEEEGSHAQKWHLKTLIKIRPSTHKLSNQNPTLCLAPPPHPQISTPKLIQKTSSKTFFLDMIIHNTSIHARSHTLKRHPPPHRRLLRKSW